MSKKTKALLTAAVRLLVLVGLYCALILPRNGSVTHKAGLTRKVRS